MIPFYFGEYTVGDIFYNFGEVFLEGYVQHILGLTRLGVKPQSCGGTVGSWTVCVYIQ
jgi:hypothetical protein